MEKKTLSYSTMRLQAVASTDATRLNINGIYLNGKVAVATDGHCLAIAKKNDEDTLPTGIYKVGKPTKDVRYFGSDSFETISEEKTTYGEHGTPITKNDSQFPDWQQVMPTSEVVTKVSIDLKLLTKVYAAIGGLSDSKCQVITLHITENALSPILVTSTTKDAIGVVMPLCDKQNIDPQELVSSWIK